MRGGETPSRVSAEGPRDRSWTLAPLLVTALAVATFAVATLVAGDGLHAQNRTSVLGALAALAALAFVARGAGFRGALVAAWGVLVAIAAPVCVSLLFRGLVGDVFYGRACDGGTWRACVALSDRRAHRSDARASVCAPLDGGCRAGDATCCARRAMRGCAPSRSR